MTTGTPIERLALYFSATRTRQGILARAALGTPEPGDAALSDELARAMSAELRADGSVGGGAVPTIWRAHELLDLGRGPDDRAVVRLVGWLTERQGKPGAYGQGCDKARHAQRLCEHYLVGFYAPAPPTERLAPITLPNGKVFRSEPAARFAISCLGLRASLRAGVRHTPGVVQHLDSLTVLAAQWMSWTGFFAPDMMVAGLHALALAGPAYRETVVTLVDLVAAHQRPDGEWPAADIFPTLEALVATGLPAALAVVRRAVPAVAGRQRVDGSLGPTAQQERALIGLRALLWAEAAP
ncbi:MAG: hypothetical protein ACJ8DJ_04800 [Gemmatimonadales bacterium]